MKQMVWWGLCAVLLTGCLETVVGGNVETRTEEQALTARQIDILFVVDNSGSMVDEQLNLVNNFEQAFLFYLKALHDQEVIDDYHIAVITTDNDSVEHAGKFYYEDFCSQVMARNSIRQTQAGTSGGISCPEQASPPFPQ